MSEQLPILQLETGRSLMHIRVVSSRKFSSAGNLPGPKYIAAVLLGEGLHSPWTEDVCRDANSASAGAIWVESTPSSLGMVYLDEAGSQFDVPQRQQ